MLKTNKIKGSLMGMVTVFMSLFLYGALVDVNGVYISDGGDVQFALTTEKSVEDILSKEEIQTIDEDTVSFTGFNNNIAHIKIDRAFEVFLSADDSTHSLYLSNATVGEALTMANIKLSGDDIINLPLDRELTPNSEIIINRISYKEESITESIPFETVYTPSSLLKEGRSRTIHHGIPGQREITYNVKYIDGVEVDRMITSQETLYSPTSAEVIYGAPGEAISDLDFGYTLDANGIPTEYEYVLTNQVATGYNAGKRAWGASGMELFYGYVATRADQIPYGTKMYITSADNSFVYGYAIAADTGVGLMQDIIDVDLYYETYLESCLNGRQSVNIYVLK